MNACVHKFISAAVMYLFASAYMHTVSQPVPLVPISIAESNAIIDDISVSIDKAFGDRSTFFTDSNGYLTLFDVGILNARRVLPYGAQYGDSVYQYSYYDYYRYIYGVQYSLSRPLPFFDQDLSDLYIHFFGYVSMGVPYTNPWRRLAFPLTGAVPMVASFWWWYYSTVYVHEYVRGSGNEYDDTLISVIENRLHLVQYPQVNTTFRPEVILSVTWTTVSSCMTILSAAELKCNNYY